MKNNRTGNEDLEANGIRKIVWEGRDIDTDEGHVVRGVVGRTDAGDYKAGQVMLYEEVGRSGGTRYSPEMFRWSDKPHAQKEHAMFAARKWAAETVRNHRHFAEAPDEPPARHKNVAVKYGGASDSLQRELPPPSRSR